MNSKAIKRQLLAAIAMVLVAAIALGSSTYAWFVASGTVEATGMTVQVQSEGGIMIKALDSTLPWASTAAATNTAKAQLFPISTYDLTDWYHAVSDDATDAKDKQTKDDYKQITSGDLGSYRRVDSFIIRPSSGTAITNAKLLISEIGVSGGNATQKLNQSLRIGVKMTAGRAPDSSKGEVGSSYYIYAPRGTRTDDKFVLTAKYLDPLTGGESPTYKTLDEKTAPSTADYLYLTDNTIPAADTGVQVDIYVWYEGEDAECKTANLFNNSTALTPDDLTVTVKFAQAALSAATGTGITIPGSGS